MCTAPNYAFSQHPISMTLPVDVSIVISTYNRCGALAEAIQTVMEQEPGGPRFELIVVDNNSSDATRTVVDEAIRTWGAGLSYVFEGKQGLSHGRNAGIARARAPIIAFTDDDVRASPVWVREIKRVFDSNPEVDFVGGKVLPRWPSPPPSWLTRMHWSALALLDYGAEPLQVDAENPRCMVGANMAFRREVFDEFGNYDPMHQPVPGAVTAVEDYEFELRLLRAGRVGMYDPSIVTYAAVQSNRLEKRYHRKWHADHGRAIARVLRPEEDFSRSGLPMPAPAGAARLFGAPAWLYRAALVHAFGVVRASLMRDESTALLHEGAFHEARGQIQTLREQRGGASVLRSPGELTRFAAAVIRKKQRAYFYSALPLGCGWGGHAARGSPSEKHSVAGVELAAAAAEAVARMLT